MPSRGPLNQGNFTHNVKPIPLAVRILSGYFSSEPLLEGEKAPIVLVWAILTLDQKIGLNPIAWIIQVITTLSTGPNWTLSESRILSKNLWLLQSINCWALAINLMRGIV